jgi:hypothetical protein
MSEEEKKKTEVGSMRSDDLFRGLQARAERLMELIKKEYHME